MQVGQVGRRVQDPPSDQVGVGQVGQGLVHGVVRDLDAVAGEQPAVAVGGGVDLSARRVLAALDGERESRAAVGGDAEGDHRGVHVLGGAVGVRTRDEVGGERVVGPVKAARRERRVQGGCTEFRDGGEVRGGDRELAGDGGHAHQAGGVGSGDVRLGDHGVVAEGPGEGREVEQGRGEHRAVAVLGVYDVAADDRAGVEPDEFLERGRRSGDQPVRDVDSGVAESPAPGVDDLLVIAEHPGHCGRHLRDPGRRGSGDHRQPARSAHRRTEGRRRQDRRTGQRRRQTRLQCTTTIELGHGATLHRNRRPL